MVEKTIQWTMPIEGMDCSDCALVIEHGISRLEGVLDASVNYAAQTLLVVYEPDQVSRRMIERRIAGLGYRVPARGARSWLYQNREILSSLLGGCALATGWTVARFTTLPSWFAWTFYILAYGLTGYAVTRHAIGALRARVFNTDVLMVFAALGAAALGQHAEGALLLFLFSLGHALEERILERARRAIRSLASLAPRTALVLRADGEQEIPVESVRLGETVLIRPGARISVDGVVLAGESNVDLAPITGESLPVEVTAGGRVFAGSINGAGALEVRATRLAQDSTLARVVKLVERAQAEKSPAQQSTEKFTRFFVPLVLVGDLALIFFPPLFGVPFPVSFLRAMTLLVAASPCALALGAPAAVLAGLAQAARNGILVKGGVYLESLAQVKAIAFDKTGTITAGRPQVMDIVSDSALPSSAGEDHILQLAAALESRSGHPLAQAVVGAAQQRGLAIPPVEQVESLTGRGVKARLNGREVLVGRVGMLAELRQSLTDQLLEQVERLEGEGKTVVGVATGEQVIGLLGLADTLRPEAARAVAALSRLGIEHLVMLSGDNGRIAATIATESGIKEVRAGLMPEQKLVEITALKQKYGLVAMVGDGINDAPALASATVGIAIGGAATDVALETADVALLSADLSRLPFAIYLGRATRAVIRQNLAFALSVIAVLVVLSLTGLAGIGLAIIIHEGSTLLVVLNALRLLRVHPQPMVS